MNLKQMIEFLGEDYDIMSLDPNKLVSDLELKKELIQKQREIRLDSILKNPYFHKKEK